jgi:hypothetical protein
MFVKHFRCNVAGARVRMVAHPDLSKLGFRWALYEGHAMPSMAGKVEFGPSSTGRTARSRKTAQSFADFSTRRPRVR